jgi:MFS family permease
MRRPIAAFAVATKRKNNSMSLLRVLRPTLPILIGASLMLSLSMGLRQSLGIFLQPLTRDVGISVSDFTLAIAVQNLAWGFLQPLAGAFTVRYGFRSIMMVGALLYIAGLVLMASAQGILSIMLGAGVLIGTSLACTAAAIAMSVAARGADGGAEHGARHRFGGRIARSAVIGAAGAGAE